MVYSEWMPDVIGTDGAWRSRLLVEGPRDTQSVVRASDAFGVPRGFAPWLL